MNNKTIFLSMLAAASIFQGIQANVDECCRYEAPCCDFEPVCCEEESTGLIYAYGEFLYWQAVQDQLAYAVDLPGALTDLTDFAGSGGFDVGAGITVADPNFKYKPGFRVGVGYQSLCTGWDIEANWTSLHHKERSSIFDEARGIIPLTFPIASALSFVNGSAAFGFASEATSDWNFQFDTVDITIGKGFCCNDSLFRPFVGVKVASIRQHQFINYVGFNVSGLPVTVSNDKRHHFESVGPSFGVETAWKFFSDFYLTSSFSAAFMYGKFKIFENPTASFDPFFVGITFDETRNNRLRPMVDGRVGIDWQTDMFNTCHVTIGVGYEVEYWWGIWQTAPNLAGDLLSGTFSPHGDLSLQGLTVRAAFSF